MALRRPIYAPAPRRPRPPLRGAVPVPATHPPVRPTPPPFVPTPDMPPQSSPDYLALIKASPGYASWAASRDQRTRNLATSRAAAIRSLALQFGGLPPGFKDAFGDLRPEDLDAAGHNQFSVEQGLKRNYEQGVENMHRSLAARGVLQSGDLGYGQNQADLARGQAEHDAGAQFLDALNQAIQGYAGGIGDINAEEPGIINQLLPLFEQLYPMPAPPGTPPAGGGGISPTAGRTATYAPAPIRPRLGTRPRRISGLVE